MKSSSTEPVIVGRCSTSWFFPVNAEPSQVSLEDKGVGQGCCKKLTARTLEHEKGRGSCCSPTPSPHAVPLSTQWPGDKVGDIIQDAVTIWKSKEGMGLWQNCTYFRASPSHSTEWNLNSERRLSSAMELGA